MFKLFGSKNKRSRLLRSVQEGPLREYLEHPDPDENDPIFQAPLLAVDFETTGLDAKRDEIISIGYVQIQNLQIDLSTATHLLIKPQKSLPENTVVIHKITDDQIKQGMPLDAAIAKFLNALKGKTLVAHHAHIESNFLNQACKQVYNSGITLPVIDTLAIEAKKLPPQQHGNNNLNLSVCCERYNLPRYRLHDALCDSLSCAELLLAQLAYRQPNEPNKLANLINYLP